MLLDTVPRDKAPKPDWQAACRLDWYKIPQQLLTAAVSGNQQHSFE
jgi:hypothetical protein